MNDQVTTSQDLHDSRDSQEVSITPMSAIVLKTFQVDNLDSANETIGAAIEISQQNQIEPVFNFDTNAELPEGSCLSVIPLTEQIAKVGRRVNGVCIAAMPSFEKLLSTPEGEKWVRSLVNSKMITSIKAAASKTGDNATSIPATVSDFATTSRGNTGLAAFNELAPIFIKVLKKQAGSLQFLTKAILKQTLSNAGFAEQTFRGIEQKNWVLVINAMIKSANEQSLDTGLFNDWLRTRDEVEIVDENINFGDVFATMDGVKSEAAPIEGEEAPEVEEVNTTHVA